MPNFAQPYMLLVNTPLERDGFRFDASTGHASTGHASDTSQDSSSLFCFQPDLLVGLETGIALKGFLAQKKSVDFT